MRSPDATMALHIDDIELVDRRALADQTMALEAMDLEPVHATPKAKLPPLKNAATSMPKNLGPPTPPRSPLSQRPIPPLPAAPASGAPALGAPALPHERTLHESAPPIPRNWIELHRKSVVVDGFVQRILFDYLNLAERVWLEVVVAFDKYRRYRRPWTSLGDQ